MPAPSDSVDPHRPAHGPAGAIELCIVGLAILVLLILQITLTKSYDLLSQPLWLDECLTHILANDPSFSHEMSALVGGVDTTPPAFYVVLRGLRAIVGPLDAVELRAFSCAMIVLALVGVYGISRRFFDRPSSIVGMMTLLAHPAILEQMFEARHYGLWLAAIAWLCFFQLDATRSRRAIFGACFCAVLVTTTHWVGAIVLGLIGGTDFFRHRSFRRALPSVVGIIALLCSLPFLLGQRSGLNVPTWIEPVSLGQIREVMRHLFSAPPLICVLLAFWICRVIRRASRESTQRLTDLLPTTSLLLVPVVLAILSYLFQPMLLLRYVTPAIFPLALLAAELSSRIGKSIRIALIVLFAILLAGELRNLQKSGRDVSARVASVVISIDEVVQQHGPLPVVVLRRLELYPALALRPEFSGDAAQLRIDQPLPFELKTRTRYEQVMGQRVHQFYDRYQLIDYSALRKMKHFFVISPPEDADEDIATLFAGATIESRGPDLFEINWR